MPVPRAKQRGERTTHSTRHVRLTTVSITTRSKSTDEDLEQQLFRTHESGKHRTRQTFFLFLTQVPIPGRVCVRGSVRKKNTS